VFPATCTVAIALQRQCRVPAVSSRPSTVESRFRFQISQREFCGRKIGTGSVFSPRILVFPCQYHGPDSSVGIATRYGLDSPGIESRWGRDFLHSSRPPLGPTQPPVQWVKRPGRGADHRTPSSAEVKERVELYLYSPSGPSCLVLGRTLPVVSIIPQMFQTHLHLHVTANRRTNWRSLGTFQKTMLYLNWMHWEQSYFNTFLQF
jgi:hypothetical protein